MDGYAEAVRERVRVARAAVAEAREAADPYVPVAEDDLDDALRLASSVAVDPDGGPGNASPV
ncbi:MULTISPECIES: hypothetical protein [Streptomyces]|uniref:hypothetical protein n=1 Tax=Streptomyces TaxID=1883 RepID=UPI000B9E4C7D|nr:hypothetical protein [Streptomyces kasugaensis]